MDTCARCTSCSLPIKQTAKVLLQLAKKKSKSHAATISVLEHNYVHKDKNLEVKHIQKLTRAYSLSEDLIKNPTRAELRGIQIIAKHLGVNYHRFRSERVLACLVPKTPPFRVLFRNSKMHLSKREAIKLC